MHRRMADTMDEIVDEIARLRREAADAADAGRPFERPRWPMLILRTPKGWTGPREVDGVPVEGTYRAHQVPWPRRRRTRSTAPARGVDAVLPSAGSSSTTTVGYVPNCRSCTPAVTGA